MSQREYVAECTINGDRFHAGLIVDPKRITDERARDNLLAALHRAEKRHRGIARDLRFRTREGVMTSIGFVPYVADSGWESLEVCA